MSTPLGLKALVVSTAALVASASGFVVQTRTAEPPLGAEAPATSPSVVAALAAADDLMRAEEASRSRTRTALAARTATLAGQARAIEARDKAIKAEAARKVAAKKAAASAKKASEAAFLKKWGFTQGTREPREMARQMMANKYGWAAAQFQCYDNIIMRESNWIATADNPTSSAYGIPQALPGRKMASAGADWLTNPATQITWGLGYVKDRFGTPCSAWSFKRANGWY